MLVPLAQHWKGGSALVSFKLETDSNILVSKARKALNKYGHKLVIGNILDTRKREVSSLQSFLIADIYISISMETFEHRKYKTRGDEGIN